MSPTAYLIAFCAVVVAVSLIGGFIPILIKLTHQRLQIISSFVAGFMLGVALLVLLPHALMGVPIDQAMLWALAGLMAMFFLERFFAYHHHDIPHGHAVTADPGSHGHIHEVTEPGHDCADHASHEHPTPADPHPPRLAWGGAASGLVLHSIIDGVALAAAVLAAPALDPGHDYGLFGAIPGLAVFLVVALHRPLDAMTLLTLTARGNWTTLSRHVLNVLFALAVPLGAALFALGLAETDFEHSGIVGAALAFSAGVFLCVALSDLLPELQFHSHDRVPLSGALLLGLGLAAMVHLFETQTHEHHGHDHASSVEASPDHADQDHTVEAPLDLNRPRPRATRAPADQSHDDHGHDHTH